MCHATSSLLLLLLWLLIDCSGDTNFSSAFSGHGIIFVLAMCK